MTTSVLPSSTRAMIWLRLLRPKQWTKNALVFAAPLGAGVLSESLTPVLLSFVAMSLGASAIYIINDLADIERDRVHPTKKARPLASGEIRANSARLVAAGLVIAALGAAVAINPMTFAVVFLYMALMYIYSAQIKHVPVLELLVVASGFVFRAVAGGTAAVVPLSSWFLIVTSFSALFVVTGKRYSELVSDGFDSTTHRPTLNTYSTDYLRYVLGVSSGLAVIAYCLWAFETPVGTATETVMRLSIIPFVGALLRYAMVVFNGDAGEPEEVILGDGLIMALGGLWLALFAFGTYLA